jgi:hypothetical protein
VIRYWQSEAWCSGLTCRPVKPEIAGSNPVASATDIIIFSLGAELDNSAGQPARFCFNKSEILKPDPASAEWLAAYRYWLGENSI